MANPTGQQVEPGHATMQKRVALAKELFHFLESAGIRYAVVGDVSQYAERIHSDLDLVMEPDALPGITGMLREFFGKRGTRLVQVLQHEQAAWYFVFAWGEESGPGGYIHPDLCGDYYRGGHLLLTAEEILAGRVRASDASGADLGFHVPAPAMAFLYYLLKRVDKADLRERHGAYLTAQWSKDPAGAEEQIRRFWDGSDAAQIRQAADSGDWLSLRPRLPALRESLRGEIGWQPSWLLGELARVLRRLRQPTGLWVAFLGPDGSGKSTVIERVREEVAPAFRRTRVVHLRPTLGRRRSQSGPVTEPHAQSPRGTFSSLIKLAYWLVDYGAGYLVQTRPALTRSTLILYDRYYPDLLADPVRYRFGGSLRLARWLLVLIPHPDLYLVLDAPTEQVHRRKSELPMAEIARQRQAYQQLARELPGAHLVDASPPPHQVAGHVEALILDHMENRVAQRLDVSDRSSSSG